MKAKLTFLLLCIACLSAFAQWKPTNGLFDGSVHSVIKSNGEIIVGTKYIYKSSNGGKTWFMSSNGMSGNISQINALIRISTYLVAGTDAGVYYSTDNGNFWTLSAGTASIGVFSMVAKGSNLFMSTVASGVYKSTNNGVSWTACNTGITNITWMRSIVVRGTDLYAATDGYGIYKSTNDGTSWTTVNTGLPGSFYSVSSMAVVGTTIIAGTYGAGVYKSTNGTSWTQVNNGISSTEDIMGMGVNGTSIYASNMSGSLFKTTDYSTWTAVPILNYTATRFETFFSVSASEFYVGCWGFGSPEKSFGVFRSCDDGATWQQIGITDYPVSVIEVSGGNILAGTNDITGNSGRPSIFKTTEADTTWTFNLGNLSTNNVTALKGNGSGVMYLFDFQGGGNSLLYRSTNNGLSWTSTGFAALYNEFSTIAFAGSTIYLGDIYGSTTPVMNSTNNGGSFNAWSTGIPTSVNYVYSLVIKGTYLFAATTNGVYRSTVGTNSWTATASTLSGKTVNSLYVSGTTIFAGVQNDGIYKTTNDGNTWTQVNTGLPAFTSATCFAAAGANIFAGTDIGVFSTINGGGLWTPINTGLADSSITAMAASTNYLWVGTNSQGVWRRQLSQLYTGIGQNNPEADFDIYPNPSNGIINLSLPETATDISLEVMNSCGQMILSKDISNQAQTTLDLTGYSKGLYFIKVQSAKGMVVRKVIICE